VIKDSGDRTEFETGAKRDMHAGKGRMDLLPWYGIMEVSKHCEEGALKYGEHNADKGIPLHSLLDSAARHLAKYIVGMDDEDHLRAACWNLLRALEQRTTHPELDDRFAVEQEKAKKKRPWISVECMNCMKRHPVAPEVWSYNADGAPIDHKVVRCLFCKANEEHKYVGDLDGYADPDETLVAVKCGDCNAHFEIPTSNWNSMKECTIHNGEVLARCPRCGKDTFISEVSADE
jgi:hypothetical protein